MLFFQIVKLHADAESRIVRVSGFRQGLGLRLGLRLLDHCALPARGGFLALGQSLVARTLDLTRCVWKAPKSLVSPFPPL